MEKDKVEFTTKELELKRENHYVWADYLKNWSSNQNCVWHTTKNDKVSSNSVKMIAKERNFYKFQYLSADNLTLILSLSSKSPKELQEHHISYLSSFRTIQSIESLYIDSGKKDKKVFDHIEAFKSNTIENLHKAHEDSVYQILKSLQEGNLSILDDIQNMCKFMSFLGHQITRTKSFKEKILASTNNIKLKKSYNEAWWFISYMIGMNFGKSFFETHKIDTHCLLINETDEDFITSDSPIINVHKSINENDLAIPTEDQADFFYAISPKLGYMINKSNRFKQGINYVSIDFVQEINKKLSFNADQYIIGTNETQLKNYKNLVGKRLKIIKELSFLKV